MEEYDKGAEFNPVEYVHGRQFNINCNDGELTVAILKLECINLIWINIVPMFCITGLTLYPLHWHLNMKTGIPCLE